MRCFLIIIGLVVLIGGKGYSQDYQFSQYYNVSPLMNPAFAGTSYAYRAVANSRIQWPSLEASYNTHLVSLDYNYNKYNTGLGVYAIRDDQGKGSIVTNEIAGQYSHWFRFTETMHLRLALQAGMINRGINGNYTLPDQFDGNGFDQAQSDNLLEVNERVSFLDISTGFLLYNHNTWLGFSAYHLNRPDQSLVGGGDKLNVRMNLIAGHKFVIKASPNVAYEDHSYEEDIAVTPTVLFKRQGKNSQLDVGTYWHYKEVLFGVWYRGLPIKNIDRAVINNESIIYLLGLRLNQFSFSFSFDQVISKIGPNSGGAYEANVIFHFPQAFKQGAVRFKELPCPNLHHVPHKKFHKNRRKNQ